MKIGFGGLGLEFEGEKMVGNVFKATTTSKPKFKDL
jgi:hypothetical protein